MMSKKYRLPPREIGVIGPHISMWMSSSGLVAWKVDFFENEVLWCFPATPLRHKLFGMLMGGNPSTDFLVDISLRVWKLRCPKRECHNHSSGVASVVIKH